MGSYFDIMSLVAVGKTPTFTSIELSGRCKGARIIVKDESKNPFGTFKDRRCAALLDRIAHNDQTIFVQITFGNSGYSLGMLAKEYERQTGKTISVVNIVPRGMSASIRKKLETCSFVYEMDLTEKIVTRNDLVEIAKRVTGYKGPEINILTVEDFRLVNGYRKIADEINEAGVKPTHIFCPVGEGELATELTVRASEIWPVNPPKIVGVTISDNAIAKKQDRLSKLGKSIADKLRNGYSKFKSFVDFFVSAGKLDITVVSERQVEREYRYLNEIAGIICEPSAAVAFCGALNYSLSSEDVVVVINTGKGIYDQKAVDKFWVRRLNRAVKHVTIALTGAALAVSLVAGTIFEHNRSYKNWRTELELKTLLYFDNDKSSFLSEDEAMNACLIIPDKKCSSDSGIHAFYYSMENFSDRELAFIIAYQEMAHQSDGWRFSAMSDYRNKWKNGVFDEFSSTSAPHILRVGQSVLMFFANKPFSELGCGMDIVTRLKLGLPDNGCEVRSAK